MRPRGRASDPVRWGAVAALAALCALAGYFIVQTYNREIGYSARATELAGATPIPDPTSVEALPAILSQIRGFGDFYSSLDGKPPVRAFEIGLNARSKLHALAGNAHNLLRRNALMPSLVAMLETQLVDLDANVETLKDRVALASPSTTVGPAMAAWIAAQAASLPEADRELFISESTAAIGANGGLLVDSAYLDAAKRIIAYKESLS